MLFRRFLVALVAAFLALADTTSAQTPGPTSDAIGVPEGVDPSHVYSLFGASVAIAGDTAVVGATFGGRVGARRMCSCVMGLSWSQQARLTVPNSSRSFGVFRGGGGRHRGGRRD